MQTFVWGEEFYTGIGKIDEQHHGLVDLFNRLSKTMVENDGVDEATIDGLRKDSFLYRGSHDAAGRGR